MTSVRYINDTAARDIAYIGPTENITSSNNEITTAEEITLNNERTYDVFKILGTKDVAAILKCSMDTARQTMSRQDFPLIKAGKNYRVSEKAFAEWLMNTYDNVDSTYTKRGWKS